MHKVKMAVVAAMMALSGGAFAQTPPPDFSKVEIKTTDLGDEVYMLEGQGGNITVAVSAQELR
jgi:cyclase